MLLVTVQPKDEDKCSQKGSTDVGVIADESQMSADQDDQSCAGAGGGLEVSTSRSGTTSERRVTRASARSQQQKGRSSVDGIIQRSVF